MTEFFEEVEEQLRSDRYKTILTKGWPYAAGALVVALVAALGWWGWQAYSQAQTSKASETYSAALETLSKGDTAGADKAFGDVGRTGPAAYKSLALMQQAGIRLTENKSKEAVELFDRAAKAAPSPVLADIAALKGTYAMMDGASYAEIEARLKPLTANGRPYRALAQEALAMARLGAGKVDEAKADFAQLLLALDAPDAVRKRAQAVQILIASGTAKSVADVAKAAVALPPPPPGALQPQPAAPPGAPS